MAILMLVLMLGLAVLGWCFCMPREIGREDEPLPSIRLRAPDVEGMVLSMRQRNQRPRPIRAPQAEVPLPAVTEGPSAMGAPQPVISQEAAADLAFPA